MDDIRKGTRRDKMKKRIANHTGLCHYLHIIIIMEHNSYA